MLVYDSARKRFSLGQIIGQGGEATIYRMTGRSDQLAKIYSRNNPGQDQKLAWMLAHPPDDPTRAQGHASIAWPLDLLYNGQGQFVGYLMPYIKNAVPLLNVFNPRLRTQTLPNFDWRYLHRTARNLAAALGALHKRDYVAGDLNESNVMVTPSALVALIDTDSFQVQEQSGARLVIYPCPMGKPEYTPPELQDRSFRGTQRLPEHDRFGLGVLIFQLLIEGSHPFRAQWTGRGDPLPIEERIRLGCFPYMKSPPCPIAPPGNVPALDTLHPRVAELVQRCFVDGYQKPWQRPVPEEWERAITEAETALVKCRSGHYYSNHLHACPRCSPKRTSAQVSLPPQGPATLTHSRPPQSTTIACPNCGHANQTNEVYCQGCAYQLSGNRRCPHCNCSVPAARHCANCGRKL
jgi:DNA-binding helix-hairpin-helix protein with protein kinase domain